MPPLVKICGLSTPETVDAAIRLGATHIGLVHYEPSPRHVALDLAAELRQRAQGKVKVALLLVNASQQLTGEALSKVRPDIIQFHGTETPEWLARVKQLVPAQIWKAIGLRDADTLDRTQKYRGIADRILFDAPAAAMPGGTGTRFDWSLLANHRHSMDWGIAGGLTPDNVGQAIAETGAPLVDVSSGVESAPGVKDVDKIAAFLKAVAA
ncbi:MULTISPECIES: phosphoribosylanthranilate isomerase [unclassified Sphingopyxis]|jgi:phosphoribosylanthranilate isomerase|uniref:phosphoribosylanthranilate isomerase n=1 Tax=unclassified Sphingopyxis TaxID=2614943 RepID=UPI0007311609|nr:MULTISPECIES: phosphoribosylanthranilate isomerase [unclassified Sphingopyxis]KTE24167.1 N-(5'-phosphoribosyl)anthranilate isomerase [Sphingopyxis sp. H057]KTE50464.1 N-(5'-phosphoribosyl)anthranilate isomerase [Sphingopyxis sp. H073]KTE52553.1 N-(5'-phosphoribosyl)anthranilate isomerase [Sphingopyxis sp. H071]KTE63046.1 N-(5'-phosphoribosyl)anthranilate isomerase [Sphingopyxis sp. H107]KTE64935.1 N-(5'-phosphoribosyl)anthranilate isomerase [Sphingopyxis sp. H100]